MKLRHAAHPGSLCPSPPRKRFGRLSLLARPSRSPFKKDLFIELLYGSHTSLHSDGEVRELVERIGKVVSLSFPRAKNRYLKTLIMFDSCERPPLLSYTISWTYLADASVSPLLCLSPAPAKHNGHWKAAHACLPAVSLRPREECTFVDAAGESTCNALLWASKRRGEGEFSL